MSDEGKPTQVIPKCKYDHGPLEHVGKDQSGKVVAAWSSTKMHVFDEENAKRMSDAFPGIKAGDVALIQGSGFVYAIYRCKVCGYLELFDEDYSQGPWVP